MLRLLPLIFILTSCSWFQKMTQSLDKTARVPGRFISKTYAEHRASTISSVRYTNYFDLTKTESYSGSTKIEFQLKRTTPITIDFHKGQITKLKVNDVETKSFSYNDYYITIAASQLHAGSNVIEIEFIHDFSESGVGLYRFEDPVDGNVYLYSDFEPYDANDMFPCFDQPDLKATYTTKVLAPKTWVVVSSVREEFNQDLGEFMEWSFPESDKFSTYIYSLHAGPYKVWKSKAKTEFHSVPLRLLARQSMAQYIDTEEWFSTTQQGFQFFEKYFDYPYPYKKYDQVIVPDFNSGAMENVAAVTFNESRYVSRGEKSKIEKLWLASTILHELAHMWFGNLVTMKWWNDIWLNESFATYASNVALVQATPYTDAWTSFLAHSKMNAYWEDQLVTTHPIVNDATDTKTAFASFDGITYGKGASVLKQLAYFIGNESFQKGIQSYFKKYANGNTVLSDFIGELVSSSEKDLALWQQAWLQTAQVNSIEASWSCVDNKVVNAELTQRAPEKYPTMRPHKTRIGVFEVSNGKLNLMKEFDLSYIGTKTAMEKLEGLDCNKVALVYPNLYDFDYVKVQLDEKSLATAQKYISTIESSLTRMGLWITFWGMVIDQKLNATEFIDIALSQTTKEKNSYVLTFALKYLTKAVESFLPLDKEWQGKRQALIGRVSEHFWQNIQAAKSKNMQMIWFSSFARIAERPQDLDRFAKILEEKPSWLKFKLDQDNRWVIVQVLSRHNHPSAAVLLEKESKKDATSSGRKQALAAMAVNPRVENKRVLWEKVVKGPGKVLSLGEIRPVVRNLYGSPPYDRDHRYAGLQQDAIKAMSKDFYKAVADLKDKPLEFLGELAYATPSLCANESVKELKKFLHQHQDLPAPILKKLKVAAQEDERCVGIREKVKKSL